MTQDERTGLTFAGAEILAVGLVPAFSKFAVTRVDPLTYSAAAVSVAAVVACAFAAARGELRAIFVPRAVVRLIPIALLGTTATTLLLFFGSRMTDGVSAALLLQSEALFSLVLTWLVWRRRIPPRQALGTSLVLAGMGLVLYDGSLRVGLGGVLILLVPLGWQLSHLLALEVMAGSPSSAAPAGPAGAGESEPLKIAGVPALSPYALTAARYLYGGAALVVARLIFGSGGLASLGARGAAMSLFHGGVLFFLGTLFWYETIRRLELARATAIVTPCEPILSVILVWALLGTVPNAWQIGGFVLLAPGLWLLVSSPSGP